MLTTIGLKNFKVLADLPRLDLSRVTILSGPNSSGKSSLIQALLLLKQTLESPASEDPIILNGSLVALGEYDDIRSFSAQQGEGITISAAIQFPADRDPYYVETSRPERRQLAARNRRQRVGPAGSYEAELTLQLEGSRASTSSNISRSQIRLRSAHFQLSAENAATFSTGLLVTRDKEATAALNTNYLVPKPRTAGYNERLYPVTLSGSAQLQATDIVACSLDHFLPREVWTPDMFVVIESLIAFAYRQTAPNMQERKDPRVPKWFVQALSETRRAREEGVTPSTNERLEHFIDRVFGGNRNVINSLRTYIRSEDGKVWNERFEDAKTRPPLAARPLSFSLRPHDVDVSIPLLELDTDVPALDLDAAANDFAGYFTNSLYYLGPLREEPRAFYRRLGSSDPMYVGQRGENTAFVLKYYGARRVPYVAPPPSDGNWDPHDSGSVDKGPLERAVKEWMAYLDLATDLQIKDVGKIGLSIQASNREDKRSTDLTNVGVGVSQALPLVVLGLASPPGATLLIEQPELHLHPLVQSRLADFFLSLTATGKQVIAETHSEHLIHRMRLYVARGTLSPEKDLAIYFFSNRDDSSESRVRPIRIGQYGEIDEWPKGFFDETTKQLDAILKATLDRAEAEEEE